MTASGRVAGDGTAAHGTAREGATDALAALLRELDDGAVHSAAALAAVLGLMPAAVIALITRLRSLGVPVAGVRGRGYRLDATAVRLRAEAIRAALPASRLVALHSLRVQPVVGSTNTDLLAAGPPPAGLADVLLAELQTGGRGRRGRHWHAPFATSLLLSLGLALGTLRRDQSALTLVVGVALLRALDAVGVRGTTLKWPNDVEAGGAKLAGVLTELRTVGAADGHVVIGIGLNLALPAATVTELARAGRRVTDLTRLGVACDPRARAALAAGVIDEVLMAVAVFGERGFLPFQAEWRARDGLLGKPVLVDRATERRLGIARGIAPDGALLVDFDGGRERVDAADVSLRVAS